MTKEKYVIGMQKLVWFDDVRGMKMVYRANNARCFDWGGEAFSSSYVLRHFMNDFTYFYGALVGFFLRRWQDKVRHHAF